MVNLERPRPRKADNTNRTRSGSESPQEIPLYQKKDYLLDAIGARRTTASLGLTDAQPLKDWTGESVPPGISDVKVRALYDVVHEIEETFSVDTAAGFLERRNTLLNGRAPLLVLANGEPEEAARDIRMAANYLLQK